MGNATGQTRSKYSQIDQYLNIINQNALKYFKLYIKVLWSNITTGNLPINNVSVFFASSAIGLTESTTNLF